MARRFDERFYGQFRAVCRSEKERRRERQKIQLGQLQKMTSEISIHEEDRFLKPSQQPTKNWLH